MGSHLHPIVTVPPPTGAAPPQTFHTVAIDNVAPLPFENLPDLQLTIRFSGSRLPENEIMFKQFFFPNGDLATRVCLPKFRTIASKQVRSNPGVALTQDDQGDPITVVTARISPSSTTWVATRNFT